MRFIIGSGNSRMTFDRPAGRDERRAMALTIKTKMFPGKAYRLSMAKGKAAMEAYDAAKKVAA